MDEGTVTAPAFIDKSDAKSLAFKAGDKVMLRQGYGGQLMPAIIFDIVNDNQGNIVINGAYLNGNEVISFSANDGDQNTTFFPWSPMYDILVDAAKTRTNQDIVNYQATLNQLVRSQNTLEKIFNPAA